MATGNAERLCCDFGSIYSRLFDHKPILKAEQNYHYKQFEGKRQWREYSNLQTAERLCSECSNIQLPGITDSLLRNVPRLVGLSNTVSSGWSDILDKSLLGSGHGVLEEGTALRKQRKEKQLAELCCQSVVFDGECDADEKNLLEKYSQTKIEFGDRKLQSE